MKIGEFLVKHHYISQDTLNEALEFQKENKDLRLGEILVRKGAFSKEDLLNYIDHFMQINRNVDLREAKDWLNQNEVDELFSKYINMKK